MTRFSKATADSAVSESLRATDQLLNVSGLCCLRAGAEVLSNFNLSVRRGEVVALLGANGAGKSTAVDGICGLAERRSGRIEFDGKDITNEKPFRIARLGLTQVSQDRDLFPDMTVRENLQLGLLALGERKKKSESVEPVLELFPQLADRLNQAAGSLSGGEQQMLTIGRALIGQPRLLLLDEPTSGLAPIIVDQLGKILRSLWDTGVTFILVEQNVWVALDVCERFVVLRDGSVVFDGERNALGASPRESLGRMFI